MPGVPFCLFGFSRIEESHAPLCTVCVPVCPAYTGPSAQRCASLRRHLCEQCLVQGHSTGTAASCSCHSLAVSWLGCHLQGAGAGHSLSAHSWRALRMCPSLPLGGWAAGNGCCHKQHQQLVYNTHLIVRGNNHSCSRQKFQNKCPLT